MARPTKPVAMLSEYSQTKEELESRKELENKIKGKSENIAPLPHLSEEEIIIFNSIYENLKESNILSNLDIDLLSVASSSIYHIRRIDSYLSKTKPLNMYIDKNIQKLIITRKTLMGDFFRCANELGLSPQARAKIANVKTEKREDELIKILNE